MDERPTLRGLIVFRRLISVCFTVPWLMPSSLLADVVSVSLSDNVSPSIEGPAGGTGTFWNGWDSSGDPLMNSKGEGTSICYSIDGDGPHADWWCDLELLSGGVHASEGATKNLQISGLDPLVTYDLYLASCWGRNPGETSFSLSNESTTATPQAVASPGGDTAGDWGRGVNYALFQNVVPDSSGEITVSFNGSSHGIINGFQIVDPGERSVVSYESWAADPAQGLTPGVNDGPLDDPDRDRVGNLVEFALKGQPGVPSEGIHPVQRLDAGEWTFEYDRNDDSRAPATIQTVEYTFDFENWVSVPIPVISNANVSITDHGPVDRVMVRLPVSGSAAFARLRVER